MLPVIGRNCNMFVSFGGGAGRTCVACVRSATNWFGFLIDEPEPDRLDDRNVNLISRLALEQNLLSRADGVKNALVRRRSTSGKLKWNRGIP